MEERRGAAFASTEQLTIMGRQLHPGDRPPTSVWITWIWRMWPSARFPWLTRQEWSVCSTW
jgi:hypothetical protein